jgi:type I restriction enzyme M protein
MPNFKKSDLKETLQRCIQLLRPTLDYPAYRQFLLTTFFLRYLIETEGRFAPLSDVPGTAAILQHIREAFEQKGVGLYHELHESFAAIEALNPSLQGVLLAGLPGAMLSYATLLDCWEQLDRLQRETSVFGNAEAFSQAYEYWLAQLVVATTRRNVAFYTPRALARLMADLLKPAAGMSICDPAARTGGMLLSCIYSLSSRGEDPRRLRLSGYENDSAIWAICKMNLIAHQVNTERIEQRDALNGWQNGPFDRVLQNLPLVPGTKKKQIQSDTGYLRHVLQILSPSGRAAVLSPAHILQTELRALWQDVLKHDWLEAVIGLPPRLLQGTPASACVLVFNKHKPPERAGQVLFVQSTNGTTGSARHPTLREDEVQRIVAAYESWYDQRDFARVVSVGQIEDQDYNLSVARYMEWADGPQTFDLNAALSRYRSAVEKREAAVERLMKGLATLDYPANRTGRRNA